MKPRTLPLLLLLLSVGAAWIGYRFPSPALNESVVPKAAHATGSVALTPFAGSTREEEWRGPSTPPSAPRVTAGRALAVCEEFRRWRQRADTSDAADLAAGVALLAPRREALLTLLRHDPERAWSAALTFAERENLPSEWLPFLEERFSTVGEIQMFPSCGAPGGPDFLVIRQKGEAPLKGRAWGEMARGQSKRGVPMEGIILDGWTVLAGNGVRPVGGKELEAVRRKFPQGAAERANASAERPAALIGGKVFHFADETALLAQRSLLAELMALPGPDSAAPFTAALGEAEPVPPAAIRRQALVAASSWTETPKSVLVLNTVFPDKPTPVGTQAEWQSVMGEVSDWLSANSYGKTSLTVTVPPHIFTLPSAAAAYEPDERFYEILNDAKALAMAAGFDASLYDITVVAFPNLPWGWAGRASIGAGNHWLNGNRDAGVIAHEFGHNFGVWHASSWDANDGSVMPATGTPDATDPRHIEYGDIFSTMGSNYGDYPDGDFSPHAKAALNWITAGQVQTVSAPGTYRIHRFDHQTGGDHPKLALKLQRADSQTFWVGYRRNFASNAFLSNGAYVLWEYDPSRCRLLDLTPDSRSQDKEDAALALGRTFTDPQRFLYITPVAQGGTAPNEWLDVRVEFSAAGNHDPKVTLAPPAGPVHARTPVTFSAAATDEDGDGLIYSWDFGNGKTASGPVAAWTFAAGGPRTVALRVTDGKGGLASASLSLAVEDPLARMETVVVPDDRTPRDGVIWNGLHVGSAGNGTARSLNGHDWLAGPGRSVSFSPNRLAAAPSRLVAVGRVYNWDQGAWQGGVETSTDGLTWSHTPLPAQPGLNAVAFAGNTFVAGGDQGTLLTSPDGLNWTARVSPVSASIRALAAVGTGFIASGDNGTILTSPEGIHWTQRATPETWPQLRGLAVNGSRVACAGAGADLWWSEDAGSTWTARPLGLAEFGPDLIAFGEGLWVALANQYNWETSSYSPVLAVSADGWDWGLLPMREEDRGFHVDSMRLQDGRLWLYSGNGGLRRSAVIPAGNQSPSVNVAWPANFTARNPWTVTATTADPEGDPVSVLWDKGGSGYAFGPQLSGNFLIGGIRPLTAWASDGRGGHISSGRSYLVDDPLLYWKNITPWSWSADTLWSAGRSPAQAVLAGGYSAFVAPLGGMSSQGAWARAALDCYVRSVTWRNSGFVAAGQKYDFSLSAWRSAVTRSIDGVAWSEPRMLTGTQLNGIAASDTAYVAVGVSGVIVRSADGVDWSDIPSGVAANLDSVAFLGSHGLAAGNDDNGKGRILRSLDSGQTWADATAELGADLAGRRVIAAGNLLFLPGWSSLRVYTPATKTWKDATFGTFLFDHLTDIVYHGSFYVGVASRYDSALSLYRRYLLVSLDGLAWDGVEMPWSEDIRALLSSGSSLITATASSLLANVVDAPGLVLNPGTLAVTRPAGATGDLGTTHVGNAGPGSLVWSVAADVPWLGATPVGGTATAVGESVAVRQLSSLPAGAHTGTLTFTAPGVPSRALTVTLTLYADDHGSSRELATAVSSGATVGGRIQGKEDTDWFSFDLTTPGTLVVWTSGGLDTTGQLFDAEKSLAFNDDTAPGWNFRLESLLPSGRFWVKVEAYSLGDYELHSTFLTDGALTPFQVTRWQAGSAGGDWSFTVASVIGQHYQVQWSADLAHWAPLGAETPATAAETTLTVRPPAAPGGRQYFRVSERRP